MERKPSLAAASLTLSIWQFARILARLYLISPRVTTKRWKVLNSTVVEGACNMLLSGQRGMAVKRFVHLAIDLDNKLRLHEITDAACR